MPVEIQLHSVRISFCLSLARSSSICYDFDVLEKSVKPLIEDGTKRVLLRSYDQLGIMNVYFLGKADFEQVEIVNGVPRFGFADRS